MYSGEYDACDVTLSVYPHRASLKNTPQACPVWIYTQSNITSIISATVENITICWGALWPKWIKAKRKTNLGNAIG
jgi:hypothetical protein